MSAGRRQQSELSVLSPTGRNKAAWLGGCILAASSAFAHLCITKEEYNGFGPSIVHRAYYYDGVV